ncbi:hypothetical protein INR49_018965 [Caranx melampygus]|nr:hypothetical protein INR49_018965 [Caranx melampygus]
MSHSSRGGWGPSGCKKHHVPNLERTSHCPVRPPNSLQTLYSEDPHNPLNCPLAKMKKVAAWSAEDVSDWLSKEGMPEYIEALHEMDGPAMLRLTKADFQNPPFSLRVPPKEHTPPLPDKFFDMFNRVEWAFSICEINGMLLVGLWLIQWILLKHRSIIGRRFFFIVGTLYMYRCITMYITTLPVPGMHFKCSPKLLGNWEAQMRRVMKMIAGGGLSITGSHTMCGDYLYSGHTVMLTLTYLFMKEFPQTILVVPLVLLDLKCGGNFLHPLAHDHYTVDVVSLKETSQSNPFSRVWWYRLFQYFEENVNGTVPRNYQLPFSWRVLQWNRGVKYSRLDIQ